MSDILRREDCAKLRSICQHLILRYSAGRFSTRSYGTAQAFEPLVLAVYPTLTAAEYNRNPADPLLSVFSKKVIDISTDFSTNLFWFYTVMLELFTSADTMDLCITSDQYINAVCRLRNQYSPLIGSGLNVNEIPNLSNEQIVKLATLGLVVEKYGDFWIQPLFLDKTTFEQRIRNL